MTRGLGQPVGSVRNLIIVRDEITGDVGPISLLRPPSPLFLYETKGTVHQGEKHEKGGGKTPDRREKEKEMEKREEGYYQRKKIKNKKREKEKKH